MPRASTKAKAKKTRRSPKLPNIVEIAQRLGRMIPEEELKNFPKDLSSQVDHYVYGWPKR
jgi:hypothetical protein